MSDIDVNKKKPATGGKADGKSLLDIAEKHDVPSSVIVQQARKGIEVEKEHGGTERATETMMDHEYEFPRYYTGLEKMEDKMKKTSGNNPQFERTFSDLAYTYLRERAPKLLDYMIGFQVLDKNEDETRAGGVFGFKIGKQWVYAPVFFINGELKGYELLYIKEQDSFVPLQENWVNYLINRKPVSLGTPSGRTERELGITSPEFSLYSRSPLTYYKAGNMHVGMYVRGEPFDVADLVVAMRKSPGDPMYKTAAESCSLPKALKKDKKKAVKMAKCMLRDPAFAEAALKFYDLSDLLPAGFDKPAALDDAGAKASVDDKDQPKPYDGIPIAIKKIQVIRGDDNSALMDGMTDGEKRKLQTNGIVIRDHRTNTTKVYETEVTQSLSTPSESGIYEMLVRPVGFIKVLVIMAPKTIGKGKASCATVVRMDGKKGFSNTVSGELLVRKPLEKHEYREFFDKLPGVDSMKEGSMYVILAPNGSGTLPFRVKAKQVTQGITELFVDEESYISYRSHRCDSALARNTPAGDVEHEYSSRTFDPPPSKNKNEISPMYSVRPIILTDKGHLTNVGDTLMVPPECKAFKIVDDGEPSRFEFSPGTLVDIQMHWVKDASVTPLKIWSNGHFYQFSSEDKLTPRMDKSGALFKLAVEKGIHAELAESMLDRSAKAGNLTFLIKKSYEGANDTNMQPGPGSPSVGMLDNISQYDPAYNSRVEPSTEQVQMVQGMSKGNPQMYDTTRPDDPRAMQAAIDASQTGQKDVFDTAVLGGLMKTTDTDTQIDQYLGDLVLGLDRIGRLLFMFYWHYEKFTERYGQDEAQELEDALKNTFKGVGDLVLFLKKRAADPEMATAGSDVDLADAAG